MEYKLRYYQEEAIKATFDYINKGGKAGVCCLPTGTGKSLIIASICKKILMAKNHVRIMMLTHVKELIEQDFEKLMAVWPECPAGIYSAGVGFKQFLNPIIFGGIQSCVKKPKLFGKIDMVIIDECHLLSDKDESMYGKMLKELREENPDLVVIGFTATPYRLGMGLLTNGPMFDDIYYDITTMGDFVKLIDEGYLCDLTPVNPNFKFDLTKVKKLAGEFSEKSLDENINRHEVTKQVVAETILRTETRNKGMAFCVSRKHAEDMAQLFCEAGLKATFVHSGLKKSEREDRINKFKSGEYNMICNMGVLTTGFDAPDVDYLVIARPTESTGLHVQIMGRGMRPHPSKDNTLVLDFAGNTMRLGPVNDPVIPPIKGQGKGEAPIRICEKCDTINHASAKVCKNCGFEFPPPKVKFRETVFTDELIKREDKPKIIDKLVDKFFVYEHIGKENKVVKISFMCGANVYDMFINPESKTPSVLASSHAKWNQLGIGPMPNTVAECIHNIKYKMDHPTAIRIWTNKPVYGTGRKVKEVMNVIFKSDTKI